MRSGQARVISLPVGPIIGQIMGLNPESKMYVAKGWPLSVTQYRTSAALSKGTGWEPGEAPGQGEAPVAIAAANILVEWGPQTGEHPATPDERQLTGLKDLVTALDRLLSPLRARTVVRVDVPGVVLAPSAAPSGASGATTADGGATPKP